MRAYSEMWKGKVCWRIIFYMGNLSDWLMGKHAGETQVKKFL